MNNFNKPAPRPCYQRPQKPGKKGKGTYVNPTTEPYPGQPSNQNSRIISDISKRVLIVEGYNEVKRITSLEKREGNKTKIINVKALANDVFEIELISRVGSFI